MSTSAAKLSRTRTVVLWELLIVWSGEMTITSVRPHFGHTCLRLFLKLSGGLAT